MVGPTLLFSQPRVVPTTPFAQPGCAPERLRVGQVGQERMRGTRALTDVRGRADHEVGTGRSNGVDGT